MQTRFSAAQLADPAIREMNGILRKCVHCGFCNSVCPTFRLTGDELDGPRGRIYLLKAMLEDESPPAPRAVMHIDRCLSCLACTNACPSGVDYMHLVDHGRTFIEDHFLRGPAVRFIRAALAAVLPHPGRLRLLAGIGRAANNLAAPLPSRLREWLRLLPETQPAAPSLDARKRYPAEAPRRGSVALLPGCVQQVFGGEINSATIRLLNRAGFDVELLHDAPCCGAIELHLGKRRAALTRVRNNVRNWGRQLSAGGFSAIVINASGCGTMVKDYGHLLRDDPEFAGGAAKVSACAVDVTEILGGTRIQRSPGRDPGKLTIAYQNPCSMQHGQKIRSQPLMLLRELGFNVVEAADAHTCCGSAGTYNLLQPDFAARLGREKAANLRATGAAAIASGNLGCMLQIGRYLDAPVLHTAQLLDWASGGPAPPGFSPESAGH